ncbi:MAG: hypothetical protein KGQ82_07635, partial [Alphaproteobacteria bacterium]|nr:hypothetical protein [Alphaproteobacteria bacterium]
MMRTLASMSVGNSPTGIASNQNRDTGATPALSAQHHLLIAVPRTVVADRLSFLWLSRCAAGWLLIN